MSSDRRRTATERRRTERVPAVFAVKKAIVGGQSAPAPGARNVQLCQAEDLTPGGMTMKRPRGTFIVPRTEVDLTFSLPGSDEEISARGVVVHDVIVGSFRRTGVRFIAVRPEHAQLLLGYCRGR